MIKMIAMDMDGTLLHHDEEFSKETIEYLQLCQKAGYTLCFSSGRSTLSLEMLYQKAGLSSDNLYFIGFNGSRVSSADEKTLLLDAGLSLDLMRRLIAHVKPMGVSLVLSDQAGLYIQSDDEIQARYIRHYETSKKGRVHLCKRLEDAVSAPPSKLLITADEKYMDKIMPDIITPFKSEGHFSLSGPGYLEVIPAGINKGTSLKLLAEHLGISLKDVIAFGDNYNDIEMIQTAGIGVAMGNAVDELKKVADDVTVSHQDNGVIKYLEKHLRLREAL